MAADPTAGAAGTAVAGDDESFTTSFGDQWGNTPSVGDAGFAANAIGAAMATGFTGAAGAGVTATGVTGVDGAAKFTTRGADEHPHIKPTSNREWPRPLRERREYNMQPVPHAAKSGLARPDNEKVGFGKRDEKALPRRAARLQQGGFCSRPEMLSTIPS